MDITVDDKIEKRNIQFAYMSWLVSTYINNNDAMDNYHNLICGLFKTKFIPIVGNDDNRAGDGRALRQRFVDFLANKKEYGDRRIQKIVWILYSDPDANMLEVMIGICLRLEDMTRSFVPDNSCTHWFIQLLNNLNIEDLTDDIYNDVNGDDRLYETMKILNDREYDSLGHGSFFPMKDTKKNRKRDYRTIEIWYQMQAWTGENIDYSVMPYAKFNKY